MKILNSFYKHGSNGNVELCQIEENKFVVGWNASEKTASYAKYFYSTLKEAELSFSQMLWSEEKEQIYRNSGGSACKQWQRANRCPD